MRFTFARLLGAPPPPPPPTFKLLPELRTLLLHRAELAPSLHLRLVGRHDDVGEDVLQQDADLAAQFELRRGLHDLCNVRKVQQRAVELRHREHGIVEVFLQ